MVVVSVAVVAAAILLTLNPPPPSGPQLANMSGMARVLFVLGTVY